MSISKYLNLRDMRAPIVVYFEHLTSEYSTIKAQVKDAEDLATIDRLNERMEKDELSWNDLYTFELILAKYRPREQLRSKLIQLRNDYRSVAGQQEYDEYIASKPQNLLEPPDPKNPPDAGEEELSHLLREDIKDLLSRLFLLYEILPVREAELKRLTWRAAMICLIAMAVLFVVVIGMFWFDPDPENNRKSLIPSLAIFVVAIAGAMGGFVSALQRIQRQPSGGDSFYNLAKLYYASYSVFIAPITGGIFAILLYLMFAAGVLEGSFFPSIYTPPVGYNNAKKPTNTSRVSSIVTADNANVSPASNTVPGATTTNASNATANASPNASPSSTASDAGANADAKQSQAGSTGKTKENMGTGSANESADKSSAKPASTPTPPTKTEPANSVGIRVFLAESGPSTGKAYAMLILWCFIAGFAERFVPDALDRLVSQKGSSGNKA